MAAIGHNDCIPQNVSLDTLTQCLEPLSQEPIRVNVFIKPPNRKIFNPNGTPKLKKNGEQEVKVIVPKYRERVAEFSTRDEFDSWVEGQSKSTVGAKGALGITNLSFHGTRQEYSFHSTNRTYLDCDSSDPGSWKRVFDALAPTGLRFSLHESSGSVRRRTLGKIPTGSPPVKWHLDLALSQTLFNPLAEVQPMGETEKQFKARRDSLPKDERKKLLHRSGYLRDEWKRKQRFLFRWVAKAAQIFNLETGGPGFDLTVAQMCQFRYVGVKYSANGPNPVVWNSRGQLALNFEKFLELAGYVPLVYTPWQPRQRVVKISNADGTSNTYVRSGGNEDLDNEIKHRLSMDEFLSMYAGISPDSNNSDGGTSWTCPLPQHPDPGERTLETNRAHAWDGDWWKCRADCAEIMGDGKSQGDILKFAHLFWGVSYREARLKLAEHLGLNPADYRGRLEKVDDTFENETDQTIRIKLTSAKKVLADQETKRTAKATAKSETKEENAAEEAAARKEAKKVFERKSLKHVSAWIVKHADAFKDSRDTFMLAMIKVILMAQEKDKDIEAVASALWASFKDLYGNDRHALLFEVENTYNRMLTKAPTIGAGWLQGYGGSWAMSKLAIALARDGYTYKPMLKYLVGCATTVGEDKDFLEGQWKEHDFDSGLMPNPHTKGSEDPKEAEAFTKFEKRRKSFKNALRRPGVCDVCDQEMVGDGARRLGPDGPDGQPTPLIRRIVCNTKICKFCFVLQTISEEELLQEMWKEKINAKRPVWAVQGTIEKMEYISAVKADLSRLSDAKLSITGWGNDGKPEITLFVNNEGAAQSVKSAILVAQVLAADRAGDPSFKDPPLTTRRITDSKEAVDVAVAARISFNLHGRRLVEEQRIDELCKWLWWSVGRVPVRNPRKESALHWPTNAQVQEQVKSKKGESWEPELWPGEVATYIARHKETNHILGRRKKIPYGVDDVHTLMRNSSSFRHANAELQARKAAAAGRDFINMETHRVVLGGAATRPA